MKHSIKVLVAALFMAVSGKAENFVELNSGLSLSKSSLGLSYTFDRNEINIGIKGYGFSLVGNDFSISPGISYNRYLTDNRLYGSIGYSSMYRNQVLSSGLIGIDPYELSIGSEDGAGWQAGSVFVGFGKVFQWTSWGLNVDANLITPANSDFTQDWGYWFGGGISYRFKLD